MTKCIVLAAGEGSRLRPLTDDRPKGLVPILGKPLVHRQLETLRAAGVEDIAIVTGYRADQFEGLGCSTFHNEFYASTNMVESLFAARTFLENSDEDILITYGDIVYQRSNLNAMLAATGDLSVMVDDSWLKLWSTRNEDPLSDAETLKMKPDGSLLELGKKPTSLDDIDGQYTGLIKLRHPSISRFVDCYDRLDRTAQYEGREFKQMYMTCFIQLLIDAGWTVNPVRVNNGWLEVDTVDDLLIYEDLAKRGELDRLWQAG